MTSAATADTPDMLPHIARPAALFAFVCRYAEIPETTTTPILIPSTTFHAVDWVLMLTAPRFQKPVRTRTTKAGQDSLAKALAAILVTSGETFLMLGTRPARVI